MAGGARRGRFRCASPGRGRRRASCPKGHLRLPDRLHANLLARAVDPLSIVSRHEARSQAGCRPIAGAGAGDERRVASTGARTPATWSTPRSWTAGLTRLGCAASAVGRRRPEPPAGRGQRRRQRLSRGRRPTVQRWGIPLGGFIPAHPSCARATARPFASSRRSSVSHRAGGALTTDGDFGPSTRRRLRAFRPRRASAPAPSPMRPCGRRSTQLSRDCRRRSTGPGRGQHRSDVASPSRSSTPLPGGRALPIDGVFTLVMTAFVSAFQAGQHITSTARSTPPPGPSSTRPRPAAASAWRAGARRAARRQPCERTSLAGAAAGRPSTWPWDGRRHAWPRRPRVPTEAQRVARVNGMAALTDDGKWGNDTRTATVPSRMRRPG